MDNLDLWNKVEKTNPAHTKNANVRGNKITAIAPQQQIKSATEQFGVYGKDWGFKSISFDYAIVEFTGIIVFHGVFFFPNAEFPITSSISAYKDGARTKPDADFAKKVETDALTKALSKLGFNADVFMGLYDDHKYVQMMNEQFHKQEPNADDMSWVKAINDGNAKLEDLNDPKYREYIKGLL
jgi:hypothetical protein